MRNSELTKDRVYIKNKVIGILVYTKDKYINIEINNNRYLKTTRNRNFLYLCNALVENTYKDTEYDKIIEHIQINFNFEGKNKEGIIEYKYQDKKGKILTESIKTIDINAD